jgi:branched-chain amino acid transport system substrate-binding protein
VRTSHLESAPVSGRALLRFALTLPACGLALAGCGSAARPDPPLRGTQLTIYSSQPQRGPLRSIAADVLGAERLALAQDGGRVGRYRVQLIALDASTPGAARSDPSQISQNARRAARNVRTVAYLGELATGTSAISIPLLNEAGILEVSPLDTALALTTASLAVAGSPERFYPKLRDGGRTFARVVPSDRSQVAALLAYMRESGVRRLAILTDEDPSGRALAANLRARAQAAGIAVVAREEIDMQALRYDDSINGVLGVRPDAALDATGARPGAARLWRELVAADPHLQLFAPAGLADPSFVAALGLAAAAAHVTEPVPATDGDPPAARRFERDFEMRYGHAPAAEARYGYEAMRSVLAAIRGAELRAPDGLITRAAVVRQYFRTAPRGGVLGAYAIDAAGDTSLRRWGAFRVEDGALRRVGALDGGTSGPG